MLNLIRESLEDDKAVDIFEIDLKGKSSFADAMIVATGNNTRLVGAMTEHLKQKLKKSGVKNLSIEGQKHCDWVLIDAGDVIIHIFRREVRDFYKIEKLWADMTLKQNELNSHPNL